MQQSDLQVGEYLRMGVECGGELVTCCWYWAAGRLAISSSAFRNYKADLGLAGSGTA